MGKNFEENELKNKIKDFCESKNFRNSFVQECITEFIERHMELYGNFISQEDLFKRLEDNLDKITFAGQEKAPNGELGEYKGRIADNTDANEILIYFNESDLELSTMNKKIWNLYTQSDKKKLLQNTEQKKSKIKSTLIHELTHSVYTIKDEYGIGEQTIFSKTAKDYLSGEYRQISGNSNNVEAIVNYIASRIEKKRPDEIQTYKAETKAIYMLAEKMGEKSIIQAAWNSDEQKFRQSYKKAIGNDIESGEKSYNSFQKIMKKLVIIRNQDINIGGNENEQILSELKQILEGNINELESNKFKDIEPNANTIPVNTFKEENKLSFIQRIAKFLEKHKLMINIPIVKSFVIKNLKALPPPKSQSGNPVDNSKNKRRSFMESLLQPTNYEDIKIQQEQIATNLKEPKDQTNNQR